MAETPLPPGAPGSPEPTGSAGTPTEPGAEVLEPMEAADPNAASDPQASPGPTAEEEPSVEGWSGTSLAVSTEEAIARPSTEPTEASLPPAPAPAPATSPDDTVPEAPQAPVAPLPPEVAPASVTTPTAAPAPEVAPPAAAAPEPEPEPEPKAEPQPAPIPTIATTLEIPAAPGAAPAEGGEFDLLVAKLRTWYAEADIAGHWQKLRGPLKGVALLLVAVLALRLYGRVVGTLDGIPIVSGLLELTGLVYLLWFSSTRLLRTSERERVLADWKERWQSFSGRS